MKLKSNEPFGLIKNGIINSYPSLRKNIETQILIIGGGITGSLIAHQCIELGYNVVLIDKREIANGSTSATTSMLQYELDVPLHELAEKIGLEPAIMCYQACYESIYTLHELYKTIKSKADFKKKKSLFFASQKKDLPWLKKELTYRKNAGFPVKWITDEEISFKYGLENTHGGILSNQGASFDAFRFTHDILEYNINRGLQVYDNTKVTDIKYFKNHNLITTEYNSEIKADLIINCTGFESTEVIKEKFVNLLSTFAMVSEVDMEIFNKYKDILIWDSADPYNYIRTTTDYRLLIGGEDENFVDPSKRDNMIDRKCRKLHKTIMKYIPSIDFRVDHKWAGTFGETKDGLPYIGVHPDFDNTFWVLGFGGNGITFSVIGMEMITSYLGKKEHPLSQYFKFKR